MLKGRPHILRKPRLPVEGLFCSYPHRVCMQNRVEGSEYCVRHALDDKNSPFKQCNYMSNKNGKRCPNAAPKSDKKDGYCADHARKAALIRQKASRKKRPRETPETLLEQIEHYGTKRDEPTGRDIKRIHHVINTNRVLDYASSGESDAEAMMVDTAWRGDADSDAESIDSEQEDPLKHAGVYTAEEVALITRDKLIRLQSLYIEQFKRLQHVMREKRRKYLHSVKAERHALGSIHAAKDDPERREQYEKLVALKRYHQRAGKEALLHRQSKERRIAVTEGASYRPPSYPKCIHTDGSVKCSSKTVPLSKFCLKHILEDCQQVLYEPCSYGNGVCGRGMALLGQTLYCSYHSALHGAKQRYPPNTQKESHGEHIDVVGLSDVKQEETESEAHTPPTWQIGTASGPSSGRSTPSSTATSASLERKLTNSTGPH